MYLYFVDSDSKLRYGGRYDNIRELRKQAGQVFRNYADGHHVPCVMLQDDDGTLRQIEEDETI